MQKEESAVNGEGNGGDVQEIVVNLHHFGALIGHSKMLASDVSCDVGHSLTTFDTG